MSSSDQNGHLGLAQRESGIIVPNHLAAVPDLTKPKGTKAVARDMDGRRRLVFSDSERRNLNRVLTMLGEHGLGMVVGCVRDMAHGDGTKPCGDMLIGEGIRTDDPGFGCKCTRIHWEKPSAANREALAKKMNRGRR